MTRKYRSHQKPKQDPDLREVKYILLAVGLVMMFFIGSATLGQQAQPLRFLDGIIQYADAEVNRVVMLGDKQFPKHGGTGTACPAITGPSSATDGAGSTLQHFRQGSTEGCRLISWVQDRTTTADPLIPKFFDDYLTNFEFIWSQTTQSFFGAACRLYEISEQGHDPRLNITGAYEALRNREQNIVGSFGQCDNGISRSDFKTSSPLNYLDSMALNNTFFSFGINNLVDDRPVAQDPNNNGNAFMIYGFTNPTALNNTVWMMQEHPKFPSSTLDGAFFGIDDTTFTMDSNTVDDTEIGQVVVFREFDKSDLGGWDVSSKIYRSGDNGDTQTENSVTQQENLPTDLFWHPDGLILYVLGLENDAVLEYNLNSVNNNDIDGAQAWNSTSCFKSGVLIPKDSNPINSCGGGGGAFIGDTLSVITESSSAQGLFFKPDGLKLYIADNTDKDIDEYTLSTPFDLTTGSYSQSGSLTVFGQLEGFDITEDGKRLYTADGSSSNITQYDLGTAWDISTISFNQFYDASVFSGDDGISVAQDVVLKPDGTRMFIMDNDVSGIVNHLETYDLSTPFDISTATWVEKDEMSHGVSNLFEGITFKNDGLALYLLADDRIYEWDILGSASSGVRITGGIVSQTSAADQWLRVEVKDGSYGTGTLDSFPENDYDIYQGAGSLGVIHIEPTTTITPFEINLKPNWFEGLEETATLFIGIDDNSTGGSTIVNITSIEWSNAIKYDFEDINVLEFYETSPVEGFSSALFDEIRPSLDDYDMGILNITEVATGSISIPALPTPSAVTNIVLNLEHYDAIEVTWDHDILNTTGYRIERDDGSGFQTVVELDANTEQSFIDANQEDQARAKIRSLLNATGLDENTTFTYRVIAINGPAEITTTSSPLTTPDSLPYWDLIEHATSSSTTPNVDFATNGGDTNDWLEMIDLDAVASGDRSAVIMKSFNKTELGIGNFTDFQTFFDTQCNTGGASSDCPNALRIIISDGKFNRYSDTMFPTNLDIFAFDASIFISTWGGDGTAHHQGGGTTFDPNLVRISPDMDKVVADDDFVTVIFSIDLGDPDAGQLDVKNFTVTNSTTWDFTNSILNYTSNLGNCNILFPDNELENSIDACDSGTIFATTSPHLELIDQTYNATTDFQYREKKDNVNTQGFSRWQISVNSTGVVATDDDSATPGLPREVGDIIFFKTFTPTSASTSLKVSVTGQPNPDGAVSMTLAAWTGILGDIDEIGRWDNGDFETNTDIFAKKPLITSGAGCSTTGPQTCSVINEEVIVDTTSFIGVPISVGVYSQDLFSQRNAIFVIHNLTIADTFYDFTNAVLKEEVSGTTADRGLVSPSSITIATIPNPPTIVNATASISNVIINWTSVEATPEVDTYWVERGLALNETWQFRQQQLDVSASFPPQCGWSDALDHLLLRGDSDVSNKKQTCYTVKTFPRDLLNGSQIQINYDYTTGIQPESVRVLVDVRDNIIEVNDDSEWNEATARNFGLTDVAEINETFLPKNTGLRTDDLIDFLSEWDEPDSEFATVIIELNDESIFSNGQRVELFWINVTDFTTGEPRAFYNFSDSPVVSFPETCSEGNDCNRGSIGSSTNSLAEVIGNTTASVNAVGKTIEEISSTADFFDDFSTDNGWESNFPSDYFIDTTAGTLNFSDATHLSPVAKISLNLESFVGDLDENLFSMRTKIVFESTDGNQSYLEMLGLSNQSSSFNQENCDATTSAVTQQLCLSQSPTFDDWQLFISNGTNTVTNNLSITSAESFIPYYVELIKVGTDYTTTVYLNENFTNQFVSFKGTVNIDFTEFTYLTLGEARASSNTGTGITGYWDSIAYWNGINITEGIPTRFNDQTVDRATNYEYRVFAENALGNGTGTISNSVLTNDFPATVTGLTALRNTPTQIDLSWIALPDDSGVGNPSTGVNLTKYQIFRSENGGAFTLVGENLRQSPPAIFFNDTSVNANFFYSYNIEACNELGCGNATSNFFVATPPDKPENLTTIADIADVLLDWTGNATTDDDYRIERTATGTNLSIENLVVNFNFDDPVSLYNNDVGGAGERWGNDNRTKLGKNGGRCTLDGSSGIGCNYPPPQGTTGLMSMNTNFGSVLNQQDSIRMASGLAYQSINRTDITDWDFVASGDWSWNAWIHPSTNTASGTRSLTVWSTIDETDLFTGGQILNGTKIIVGFAGNLTDGNNDFFAVQTIDEANFGNFVINETSPTGMWENDSTFHMFTIVHKNGEYIKWYRDGVLLETDFGTASISGISDLPPLMGQCWNGGAQCKDTNNVTQTAGRGALNGGTVQTWLDEWSWWDMAIDSSDVTTLYGSGDGFNFTGHNVIGDDGSTPFEIIVPSLLNKNNAVLFEDFSSYPDNATGNAVWIQSDTNCQTGTGATDNYCGVNATSDTIVTKMSGSSSSRITYDLLTNLGITATDSNGDGDFSLTWSHLENSLTATSGINYVMMMSDGTGPSLTSQDAICQRFIGSESPTNTQATLHLADNESACGTFDDIDSNVEAGDDDFEQTRYWNLTKSGDNFTTEIFTCEEMTIGCRITLMSASAGGETYENLRYIKIAGFNSGSSSTDYIFDYDDITFSINGTLLTSYRDRDVELGTIYSYQVTSLNGTNPIIPSEPSQISTVTTNDAPAKVQNLQTEFTTPTKVDIQWDDLPFDSGIGNPSTGLNLTKYQVFRQDVTGGSPFVLAGEVFASSPPQNFFNDTVSPGFPNVYSYQISGCNAVSCGSNSTAVTSEVTVVPNPVLNMIATAVDKTVSLDWDDSAFALNYTVLRNLNIPTVTIFSDDFSGTDNWTDTGSKMGVNTATDEIDWDGKRDTTNHATAFDFTSISDMEWELRGKIHFDTITAGTVFEHVFITLSDSDDSVASSTSQDHVSLFFSIATSGDTKAGINSGTDALDEVAQASFTDNLYVQGDDVWFKLQRTSELNYGATLYSDAFITPLESISATDLTASTDGLQYVKVQNSATVGGTGAFDGIIDDIILEETSTIFQIIAQGVLTSDYIDTTVLTNANYSYSAWGVNDIGNGTTGFSNSVITNDLPTEPLNLTGAMGIVIPDLEDVFLDWDIELDNGTGNPSTGVPIIDYTIERKQGLGSFSFLANVSGGIFAYEDESVISGANYTYHVKGTNIVGMSSFSNTFSIITTPLMPPDTPTDLTANTLSGSEIQLDWLAAVTGDPASDYVLQERHVGFGGFSTIATILAPTLTFTSTSLVAGDTYDYQVRADNGAGSSGYSNIATNTTFTVPTAPQNLGAETDSDTQISLDWDEPASTNGGIVKYNIEQESPIGGGFSEIAEIVNTNTPEELFLDDLFNNNGTIWQYRQAKAGVGGAFSSCAIDTAAGDRVRCIWSDGGASTGTVYIFKTFPRSFLNNTQIQISLSETDSSINSPHTVKSTDVSAEILNYLDRNREAEWPLLAPRNFAIDLLDGSSPVGIIDMQTHAVLADDDTPQTFDMIIPVLSSQWSSVANSNYSSIIIEFFDSDSLGSSARNNIFWINITDIDTGEVRAFYNFTGSSRTNEAQDGSCTPKCARGTITAGSSTFINSTGFELQSLNETNTQFTVTGLTTKTEYNFRVNAENVVGTSPYSNEAANTTFGVPDAPINLSGVSNGVSEITVTWDEGLSNFGSAVTGYRIDQAQGIGGTFVTAIANTGDNIEPLTETFLGLLQQTTYVYRIAAINGFGLGPFSANLTTGTFIGSSAPENFFVVFNATRPYSTFMSWETPLTDGGQPIAGYLIERKDVGGSFQLIANLTSPLLLNFTDTNLLNLAQHEYRVAAYSNPTGSFTPGQEVATVVTPNFVSFVINDFSVVGDVLNQQYTVVIDDCFPACTLTQADIERNGIVESNYVVGEPIVLDSLLNFTTFFIIPTSGTQFINTTAIVTNLGTTGDEETGVVTTSLEFVVDTIFFNHSRNTAFDKLNFELVRHPVPWNAECELRGGRAAVVDTIIEVLPFGGTITLPGTIVVDPTAVTATLSLQEVGSYESPPQFNVIPSRNAYMSCDDPVGSQILAFVSFGTGNGTLALTGFTNQLGTFLGVPVPFIFIIILAAIWTGRSASTGIIFLAVAIGAMGVLGYFDPLTGDPTQGETSLAYFWLFIVFLTLVGVFLGKRFF